MATHATTRRMTTRARTGPPHAPGSVIRGKHVPNLVMVWDSEKGKQPEFRVQLEVLLDELVARKVQMNLWGGDERTPELLRETQRLVVAQIPAEATPVFREIVEKAFENQPEITG